MEWLIFVGSLVAVSLAALLAAFLIAIIAHKAN